MVLYKLVCKNCTYTGLLGHVSIQGLATGTLNTAQLDIALKSVGQLHCPMCSKYEAWVQPVGTTDQPNSAIPQTAL
jgi:hypothetical protein